MVRRNHLTGKISYGMEGSKISKGKKKSFNGSFVSLSFFSLSPFKKKSLSFLALSHNWTFEILHHDAFHFCLSVKRQRCLLDIF